MYFSLKDLNEDQLRGIFDNVSNIVLLVTDSLDILYANKKAVEFYGFNRDEIIGMNISQLLDDNKLSIKPLQVERLREEKILTITRKVITKSGETRFVDVYAQLIDDIIITIQTDITDQKKIAHDLDESQSKLKERVKELQCLYQVSKVLWDDDRWVTWEEKIERICNIIPEGWQYPEITHCKVISYTFEATDEGYVASEWYQESPIFVKEKKWGTIQVNYEQERPQIDEGPFLREERALINNLAEKIGRNIERLEYEKQIKINREKLQQKQRMEAIGRLAGGIAHDFNNILSVIIGQTELIQYEYDDPDLMDRLSEIQNYSKKAANLVEKLLTFSKQQVIDPKLIHVNNKLEEYKVLLSRLLKEYIELEIIPDDDVKYIKIDEGQFSQILINSVVNSREAISNEGRIEIKTSVVKPDSEGVQNYAKISIVDNGKGIDKDLLDSIFDPFFSTKSMGSGLGLAIVYGIVKQAGGQIKVNSIPGTGTTFDFLFPMIESQDEQEREEDEKIPVLPDISNILIVEDNPELLRSLEDMLENDGYLVSTYTDPNLVLLLDNEKLESYDLILTDIVMPEINGIEIARYIKSKVGNVPIIFMSGYVDDKMHVFEDPDMNNHFIQKPFFRQDLYTKFNEVLDEYTSTKP